MSYLDQENSVSVGAPVELYRFALGAQRFTFTASQAAVIYQNETYAPVALRRSAIEQGNEINRAGLTLTLPRDNPLADLFLASPPEGVVSVTLRRFHRGDPLTETLVVWKGRVGGARLSGSELTLTCESVATSLKRTGLRARYSLLCRHALYSTGCGALKEAHRVDAVLTSVSGATVNVAAPLLPIDGTFVAGMLATNAAQRMIVGHVGPQITLVAPLPSLSVGAAVRLYAGCDHALSTCRHRFNNLDNYGGFPFIPLKNPFVGDAIV